MRALREDRALGAVFALLTVATLVPIWIGHYLPLLDLPNHLSAIAVWHHHHDPRFDFDKYYDLNLSPLPYWAHYYVCHLLAYLFSVETANKIFLSAYAIALPAGTLAFARRFGRSPWLALFAFPLVWNFNLAEGFIAFVAGMASLVIGLVAVDKHCEKPSVTGFLTVLAFGTTAYFFHLLTYMMFLVCAGLLVFARKRPLQLERLIVRGVPVLLGAAVGIWAYRRESTMGFQSIEGARVFAEDLYTLTLARAPYRLLNFLSSSRDEWVVVVLAFAWIVIAIDQARHRDPDAQRPRIGPELCFAVCLFAILWLPRSMNRPFNWYMINGRFVPLAALFGALLIRGPITGRRRWLLAPVAAASLFYAVDLSVMVVRFNRNIAGFDAIADQIPLHKSTITLVFPPLSDPQVNVNCFNQWASYAQIRRGGYNFYNFNYGFPLKYRSVRPAPPWTHAEWFNWDSHSPYWDYFLTHNEPEMFEPLAKAGKVRLVDARGPWKLWEKIEKKPE
jgi:hypothetical protein